jgi:DNA-binding transcriptional MocR family regulator
MTRTPAHWIKKLQKSDKAAYIAMADLIAEDIRTGRLNNRDRLPTLRELADDLGLNYTTVARGYSEARKRGLIDSHVGMGTYVRGVSPSLRLRGGSAAEMTMNLPPEPSDQSLLAHMHDTASGIMGSADLYSLLRYQDFGGTLRERELGAQWLRPYLPDVKVSQVLIAPGIHSVLLALMSMLARPGELVCVESLSYPGIKAIASQLGIQLHPLPMDFDGPIADSFEHACKTLKPKALYCNPTLLNPTTDSISQQRREALVDIALKYSLPIIEDDAYGMLPLKATQTLATLAPDITYYVSGFAKCFGAGLRTAYVASPNERLSQRLAGAMRATTVMASPFTNTLASHWIEDGTVARMLQAVRAECASRFGITEHLLGPFGVQGHAQAFHCWLPLPTECVAAEFSAELRTKGVAVVPSVAFSTDGDPPNAVRICTGGATTIEECERGIQLVVEALKHPVKHNLVTV